MAGTLNEARGKRCDIDGKAEGRLRGSEGVKLYRNRAVGFIDWLDGTAAKPLLKEIMRLRHQPPLFGREIITTEPLHVFERIEKLELLICMCNHRRVGT